MSIEHDRLLIIDFGSQVTQLIARRLRELNVYCEIHPFQTVDAAFLKEFAPKAVILSGGPASVIDAGSPRPPEEVFDLEGRDARTSGGLVSCRPRAGLDEPRRPCG